MQIESLIIRALSLDLDRVLTGLRVEKIHQPEPEMLLLRLHPAPEGRHLAICIDRIQGHVTLTHRKPPNPFSPPAFCGLLRKQLSSARIRAVSQPGLERMLEIVLTAGRDGKPVLRRLVIELFGNRPNIYLVDEDDRILGACRDFQKVERLSGAIYRHPAAMTGTSILDSGSEEFEAVTGEALGEGSPRPYLRRFIHTGKGLGRLLLESALSGGAPEAWRQLAVVRGSITVGVPAVISLPARDGKPSSLVPWMPAAPLPEGATLFSSAAEAVESVHGQGLAASRFQRIRDDLTSRLDRRHRRARQRLDRVEEDLDRASQAERFERWGHLLQAHPHCATDRSSSVTLPDLFEPEAPAVEIPLKPGHSIAQNAAACFNRARRLRRTMPFARKAQTECQQELVLLDRVRRELEELGAKPADEALAPIRTLAEQLSLTGFAEQSSQGKKVKKKLKPSFREFRSSEGKRILVGRSAKENDYLSTRVARRGDLWLHAHETSGAHVVVKLGGADCPRGTLIEAAQLAAHHSPHRYGSKAIVAYTPADQVKKPGGAPAGLVTLRSYRTLVVPCDPSVVTRLAGAVSGLGEASGTDRQS